MAPFMKHSVMRRNHRGPQRSLALGEVESVARFEIATGEAPTVMKMFRVVNFSFRIRVVIISGGLFLEQKEVKMDRNSNAYQPGQVRSWVTGFRRL